MFGSLFSDIGKTISRAITLAGLGIAMGFTGVIAFAFFLLAAFVWVENTYGTITAALAGGILFLLLAVVFAIAMAVIRSRARKRAQMQKSRQRWWADPAVMATGVEVARVLGFRKLVPAALVAGVILAFMQSKPPAK